MASIHLPIRQLVEFLLRTGSIDSRFAGFDRANEGARIHRKLQKAAGEGYQAEVFLSAEREACGIAFTLEGRADGIFTDENGTVAIDEIKTTTVPYEEITEELIQAIKTEEKVCHYLDIPIQHASDRILKRMGRRTSKQELIDIVGKLRKEIPDIVLRTTLITGFPGETEEDHEELKEFVDEMEFDRLGVFTYSPEENTPAAEMADQVPEEVKEERRDELMELQQEISYDRGQDRIGQELLVMIEGKVADESAYIGRTYGDAPKVDGYIFVQTGELLMTGDFAKVRVTGALEYDLIGVLSDEYTE